MSEWLEIISFLHGDVKTITGADQSAIATATDASNTVAPVIALVTDYYLRDEYNEIITDRSGEGLSLEGLSF